MIDPFKQYPYLILSIQILLGFVFINLVYLYIYRRGQKSVLSLKHISQSIRERKLLIEKLKSSLDISHNRLQNSRFLKNVAVWLLVLTFGYIWYEHRSQSFKELFNGVYKLRLLF